MRFRWKKTLFNLTIVLLVLTGIFYLQIARLKFSGSDNFQIYTKHGHGGQINTDEKIKFENKNNLPTTIETLKSSKEPMYIEHDMRNEGLVKFFKLIYEISNSGLNESKIEEFLNNENVNNEISRKHLKQIHYILQEIRNTNTEKNMTSKNAFENIIEKIYSIFIRQFTVLATEEDTATSTTSSQPQITPKIENIESSTIKPEKKSQYNFERDLADENLLELHYRIQNFTSDDEVKEFYARDKRSIEKFSEPIETKDIHKYIKYLFPQRDRPWDDRILAQLHLKLVNSTTKVIHVRGGSGTQKALDERGCNIGNCIITRDTTKYQKADAVLFGRSVTKKRRVDMSKDEVWIFSNLESPLNSGGAGSYANWSETYRRDSVIVAPYERFTTFPKYTDLPEKPVRNFAEKKKKLVAWFVSNCHAATNRDEYAKQLQKYIPVDIYGRCGDKKCNRRNNKCFEMLKTDYKFYLSFENSACKDYISEKLYWNAYQNEVVPIVLGAHPNEYKAAAPPRSFLHVDMFQTPKQLAEYLIFLDKHDDLYNSYFLWKGTGDYIDTKSICRICAMVHVAPYHRVWYDNPTRWWNGVCSRRKPNELIATWKKDNKPIL